MIKQKLDEFINHNLIKGWLVIFMFANNSLVHLVQQKGVFAARLCFCLGHIQFPAVRPACSKQSMSSDQNLANISLCTFHRTQMK